MRARVCAAAPAHCCCCLHPGLPIPTTPSDYIYHCTSALRAPHSGASLLALYRVRPPRTVDTAQATLLLLAFLPFCRPGQAGRQTRSTEFRSLFSYTTPYLSSARKKPRTLYACSQQCWACCSDGRSSATQDGKLSRTDHRARVHGTMWVPALLVFCLCGGAVGQLSAPVAHDGHVSTDGNKFLQNSATLDSGAL